MNNLIKTFLLNNSEEVEKLVIQYLLTANDIVQQEQKFNNEIFINVSLLNQINKERNSLISNLCKMIIDWFTLKYISVAINDSSSIGVTGPNISSSPSNDNIQNINKFLLDSYI